MTADGLAGERAPALEAGLATPLPTSLILGFCDGLLGEIGRRQHRFAWLRPVGSGPEDWLVVEAYYPGNRIVVVCRDESDAHDHLYDELVPAHGLRLLRLAPAELGDRPNAEPRLTQLIAGLGPVQRPIGPPLDEAAVARESAISRLAASFANATAPAVIDRRPLSLAQTAAIERAARVAAARNAVTPSPPRPAVPRPRAAPRPSVPRPPLPAVARPRAPRLRNQGAESSTMGMVVGVVLAVVLSAEMYFGVGKVALEGNHWLLGFGIALDVCSRALGTIAAGRAGRPDWAWGCVVGGSPVVAVFALFGPEGPLTTEPGPLAGLLSVLAMSTIAVLLLAPALGI